MLTHDTRTVAALVQRILSARTRAEALLALETAVSKLGFDGFCLGSSSPVGDSWALSPILTNWPAADIEEYARERYFEIDPTLTHLRRFHTPYVWDARRPPTVQSMPFFDFLLRTPVRCGIVYPLGMYGERLWVLSASCSEFRDFDQDAIALLPLFGHAARCMVEDVDRPAAALPISAQQLAFLRLAAEGKSSADIATITGHSRRTVDYHFTEIRRKLKVATRAQAIMDLPLLEASYRPRP